LHRIDTPDSVEGLFQDSGSPGTRVTDDWLNDVQENLVRLAEAFGLTLAKGDFDQLTEAFAGVGLPGRALLTNLNTLDRSGFFASGATATGRPAGTAEGMVVSVFDAADSADGVQLFVEKAADRLWLRRWTGAAWQAWRAVAGGSSGVEATGRWRIHPDGVIEQYGYYAGGSANPTITFPIEFPTACDWVSTSAVSTSNATPSNSQGGVNYASPAATPAPSTTGFAVWCSSDDGGPDTNQPSTTVPFYWRAMGR
jgi:hypothetical protein